MEVTRGISTQPGSALIEISNCGLTEWWLSTFTLEERGYIDQTYRPYTGSLSIELDYAEIPLELDAPNALLEFEISGLDDKDHPLAEDGDTAPARSAAKFLGGLGGWFYQPTDRHIALRILNKAETLAGSDVIALHFIYHTMIKVNYRSRELAPGAMDAAVTACEKQIALGPQASVAFIEENNGGRLPSHTGFKQLAIIREKQQDFGAVVRLCEAAARQGWTGDWQKRIDRCRRKIVRG